MFGHKVPPDAGVHFYSAMKFALKAVTEGIRLELRNMKSGIKITVSMWIQCSFNCNHTGSTISLLCIMFC